MSQQSTPAVLSYSDAQGPQSIVLEREATTVGRAGGNDIILNQKCVSRQHAVLRRGATGYSVTDENSTHGTFLNGRKMSQAGLRHGDVLHIGSLQGPALRFEHRDSTGSITGLELLESLNSLTAARDLERLNWLLNAARQLNSGGAVEEILAALVQLTLQLTGVERGFVFLVRDGEMHLEFGRSATGDVLTEDATISRRAMRQATGSASKFYITDTLRDGQTAEWQSVVVNHIRSIYCIPLRRRAPSQEQSELLGLLYLDSQVTSGKLTQVDHQLLDTIATEAAALVENVLLAQSEQLARAAREELSVAARIHGSLMAIQLPSLPYAVLKAHSVPCADIGGDFYDAVRLSDCVCITIADVSGKGVSAAIVAATLQGIIYAQLLAGQGLVEIASLVNQFLCAREVGKYATLVMLKLFPDGTVEYVNCGHIQPLSILGDEVRRLGHSNLIVGLIPTAAYTAAHCALKFGERILLVTDGVTEAENESGEPYGDRRLAAGVRRFDLQGLLQDVNAFAPTASTADDCTLVEIQYLPNSRTNAS